MGQPSGGRSIASLALLVVIFIVYWIAAASISNNRAVGAVQELGYTDVHVVSSTIWFVEFRGCGDDEKMWTVTGIDPHGVRRTLTVCGGIFKGATVRYP